MANWPSTNCQPSTGAGTTLSMTVCVNAMPKSSASRAFCRVDIFSTAGDNARPPSFDFSNAQKYLSRAHRCAIEHGVGTGALYANDSVCISFATVTDTVALAPIPTVESCFGAGQPSLAGTGPTLSRSPSSEARATGTSCESQKGHIAPTPWSSTCSGLPPRLDKSSATGRRSRLACERPHQSIRASMAADQCPLPDKCPRHQTTACVHAASL